MDMTIVTNGETNVDKIQIILNVLKRQINQFAIKEENMKMREGSTRNERIGKLMVKTKRLSAQIQKIREDIRRYEKKYEKALKRKVKNIKMQIKEDTAKLDVLKEKYNQLEPKITVQPPVLRNKVKWNLRKLCKPLRIKGQSKLKHRNAPINRKIKIKIKKNKKLGRPEMLFVNDDNAQQPVTELVNSTELLRTPNPRECRITLQRLTEEQTRRYIGQIQSDQLQTKKQIPRESPKSDDNSQSTVVTPKWHIKIPRSILEESESKSKS